MQIFIYILVDINSKIFNFILKLTIYKKNIGIISKFYIIFL